MQKEQLIKMLDIMELSNIAGILNESMETVWVFARFLRVTTPWQSELQRSAGILITAIRSMAMSKKRYLDFLAQLNLAELPQDLRAVFEIRVALLLL